MMLPLFALSLTLIGGSADTTKSAGRTAKVPPAAVSAPDLYADSIVVEKGERRLTLFFRGAPIRTYGVALGRNPIGDKERQGDGRTPEGVFRIEFRNPNSKFHLALRLNYPDAAHLIRAEALGVSPGGDIMIHGLPKGYEAYGPAHRDDNWTEGCVALTNQEIEEIWRAVRDGTPVEIKP
jgi:murein L,D-transpeptidase YafK